MIMFYMITKEILTFSKEGVKLAWLNKFYFFFKNFSLLNKSLVSVNILFPQTPHITRFIVLQHVNEQCTETNATRLKKQQDKHFNKTSANMLREVCGTSMEFGDNSTFRSNIQMHPSNALRNIGKVECTRKIRSSGMIHLFDISSSME